MVMVCWDYLKYSCDVIAMLLLCDIYDILMGCNEVMMVVLLL